MPLPDPIRQALFWVAVLVFVLAQGALLARILLAPRPDPSAPVRARFGRGLELAMVLAPAVLMAFIFVFAWRAISAPSP